MLVGDLLAIVGAKGIGTWGEGGNATGVVGELGREEIFGGTAQGLFLRETSTNESPVRSEMGSAIRKAKVIRKERRSKNRPEQSRNRNAPPHSSYADEERACHNILGHQRLRAASARARYMVLQACELTTRESHIAVNSSVEILVRPQTALEHTRPATHS